MPPVPSAGPPGTKCIGPSLTVKRGESATYYLRLTESPTPNPDADPDPEPLLPWWVMLRVKNSEGTLLSAELSAEDNGVRWVPSIGREIHEGNWDQLLPEGKR